jgi:threonylcarbamoyladenosine tRNA methylthiotransferase MtaB
MHIFPYSKRPGTPASDMKDQVPNSVKKERCEIASEAAEQLRVSYLTGCIHTVQSVLFESGKSGTETGHARNYCLVEAPGSGLTNQIRNVLITGMKNGIFSEKYQMKRLKQIHAIL